MSNILDRELIRRKPVEGPHGEIVGMAVVDSKLFVKVTQGEKSVARIESFLVFPVAALYFAVVPGCIRTDQLMPDFQALGSCFKESGNISLAVGKTVSEFKAVVSLDTLNVDSTPGVPLYEPFQKIGGRIRWIVQDRRPESAGG